MFVRFLLISLVATALAWSVLARSSESAGQPGVYTVRSGDTLWSIAAARYPGDPREGVWKLQRANRVGTTIQPGQRLLVPAG